MIKNHSHNNNDDDDDDDDDDGWDNDANGAPDQDMRSSDGGVHQGLLGQDGNPARPRTLS